MKKLIFTLVAALSLNANAESAKLQPVALSEQVAKAGRTTNELGRDYFDTGGLTTLAEFTNLSPEASDADIVEALIKIDQASSEVETSLTEVICKKLNANSLRDCAEKVLKNSSTEDELTGLLEVLDETGQADEEVGPRLVEAVSVVSQYLNATVGKDRSQYNYELGLVPNVDMKATVLISKDRKKVVLAVWNQGA